MSDEQDVVLTRLTVDITKSAYAALETTAWLTGDTLTDTVGRALLVYEHVVRAAAHGRGRFSFNRRASGPLVRVEVNRPWWKVLAPQSAGCAVTELVSAVCCLVGFIAFVGLVVAVVFNDMDR